MAAAPDELSTGVSLALDPAGAPVVTIAVCYCGQHEQRQHVNRWLIVPLALLVYLGWWAGDKRVGCADHIEVFSRIVERGQYPA